MAEYIKREEAKLFFINNFGGVSHAIIAARLLDEIPPADVAPVVHGHWEAVTESEMTGWNPAFAGRDPIGGYICSHCGGEAVFTCDNEYFLPDYCPDCGAKMYGGADHETD